MLLPFTVLASWVLLFSAPVTAALYPPDVVDKLASSSMSKLKTYLAKNSKNNCTLDNAVKRVEWSDMSTADRHDYIQAVLCLQSKPPKAPSSTVPGTRNRYDDFVATHIVNTPTIHQTANFLAWHRYFLWLYEQALRSECGYKGYQPYWNWDRYAQDPINSPLFNGNATSMGGNGAKAAYSGVFVGINSVIPPGQGGGCVTTGPFTNMSVNLGPLSAVVNNVPPNPRTDGLGYNPRCLRRDVNKISAAATTANNTYDLITKYNDVYSFQTVMQGGPSAGNWGVHIGGHYTVGGDPGGDFYTSPGDPAFWLHHGMIDRVWWIWQLQDLSNRLTAISGSTSMMGFGRNGTLTDVQDLGWTGPKVTLGDLLNTMGGNSGKFCYIYV